MINDDKQKAWNGGFKAYWDKKPKSDCPDYPEQELRDEWMDGWLTAENANECGI